MVRTQCYKQAAPHSKVRCGYDRYGSTDSSGASSRTHRSVRRTIRRELLVHDGSIQRRDEAQQVIVRLQ